MIINKYIFTVPKYQYSTRSSDLNPSVELEIFRMKLIWDMVREIKIAIDDKLGSNHNIYLHVIHRYISQLVMNILTNKTFTDTDTIYLDDGLFNLPVSNEINDFYRDINYSVELNLFEPDEFNIFDILSNTIKQISNISKQDNLCQECYTYNDYQFYIKPTIVDKYKNVSHLLQNLVIDKEIFTKTKAKYIGKYFLSDLLCCLLRYISLGSGANQYVVDIEYKKLLKQFGFNFECFASSLNHYYDNYCSMFYDIERYFGSSGSFMCLKITQGMYMCNPPYDNNLLETMYEKVKQSIVNKNVIFIASIPLWYDYKLEETIDQEHLYNLKEIKYEYFMNPITKEKTLIPPYISYLFYGKGLAINLNLNKTFTGFENYYLQIPIKNKKKFMEYIKILFQKLLQMDLSTKNECIIYQLNDYKYYMLSDILMPRNILPQYIKYKNDILEYMNKNHIKFTPIELREYTYQFSNIDIPNPLLIKFFIKKYKINNVMDLSPDLSPGIIGSMLENVIYFGIGTWSKYSNIIKIFKNMTKSKINIYNDYSKDVDMIYLVGSSNKLMDKIKYAKYVVTNINIKNMKQVDQYDVYVSDKLIHLMKVYKWD